MENVKYVVLLYKYDVVEVGDLFVILHIYNKILSYKKIKHIRDHYNVLADLLSRLQVEEFLRRHPVADKQATYFPQDLWDI